MECYSRLCWRIFCEGKKFVLVRKNVEEGLLEVAEEEFGNSEENTIRIYGKEYPVAPCNEDLDSISESSKGCAHVYGQLVKLSRLLENDLLEVVACANCKSFRLSNFSAQSGRLGYCRAEDPCSVNAAHHCHQYEFADNWKTRHGLT